MSLFKPFKQFKNAATVFLPWGHIIKVSSTCQTHTLGFKINNVLLLKNSIKILAMAGDRGNVRVTEICLQNLLSKKKQVEKRHFSVKSTKIGKKSSSNSNSLPIATDSETRTFVKNDISKLTNKSEEKSPLQLETVQHIRKSQI